MLSPVQVALAAEHPSVGPMMKYCALGGKAKWREALAQVCIVGIVGIVGIMCIMCIMCIVCIVWHECASCASCGTGVHHTRCT